MARCCWYSLLHSRASPLFAKPAIPTPPATAPPASSNSGAQAVAATVPSAVVPVAASAAPNSSTPTIAATVTAHHCTRGRGRGAQQWCPARSSRFLPCHCLSQCPCSSVRHCLWHPGCRTRAHCSPNLFANGCNRVKATRSARPNPNPGVRVIIDPALKALRCRRGNRRGVYSPKYIASYTN